MGNVFEPRTSQVNLLTPEQQRISSQLSSQLSALLTPGSAQEQQLFERGILDPALRTFEQRVQPQISSAFARHGATLGSARGNAISQALTDVFTQAQASRAGLQQQALGLGGQFQQAPLSQTISQPGIGSQLAQLGGTFLGAGLFGQPGAQPAGAQGTGLFGLLGK
jgi:hypothetical protein